MSSGTFQSGWRGSEKVSLGVTRTVRKGLRPTSVVEAWVVGVGTTGCVEPAAPLPPSSCVKVGLLDFLSASRVAMLAKDTKSPTALTRLSEECWGGGGAFGSGEKKNPGTSSQWA